MPNSYELIMYVVYDHPADYPEEVVVRCNRWDPAIREMVPEKELFARGRDLLSIHRIMADMGLYFLYRSPGDDPVIVGTYL